METKKFTQFGTFLVILLLPVLLLSIALIIKSDTAFFIHLLAALIVLPCLLIFYKLTIIVDDKTVSFRMGIGLVKKTYKLSEIKSCKPVTNSLLTGIGIRVLGNGMLYNVSGLKAIELRFKYKSSIVRIGTNKPEEISRLIQSLIGGEEMTVNMTESSIKDNKNPEWMGSLLWITPIILLLIISLAFIPSIRDIRAEANDKELKIKGAYGITIPYAEITQVDTLSNLPGISLRTNGYGGGNTLIGNFKMVDGSHSKLFIKRGFPPYIVIQSKDRAPIYINFKDNQKTRDLYMALKQGALLPDSDIN